MTDNNPDMFHFSDLLDLSDLVILYTNEFDLPELMNFLNLQTLLDLVNDLDLV